jgi:prepilin-type N-terminal cleavage/methylation domain-containing protein
MNTHLGNRIPARSRRGMTLMESLLALAVFGVAALALVKTLRIMGEMTLETRTMRMVEQGIESLIDEYGKVPALDELDEEVKGDSKGVAYRVQIRPVQGLMNREGRELQGFYLIKVTASWIDGGRPVQREAEMIRFANAFVPMGG